jgi:hypothetical protein
LTDWDLTKKQRELVSELEQLSRWCGIDYHDIKEYERPDRTNLLEAAKDQIIRSHVIMSYVLVDEFLNCEICGYNFGRKHSFQKLWRTKRFQRFNHHVIEGLSLLQKLRYVRSFVNIPKVLVADIERLNSLRNGLAHSLFPQNLRSSKPMWKGKDIFSLEGIKVFGVDFQKIKDFFFGRMSASYK